jgi:MFS family permease
MEGSRHSTLLVLRERSVVLFVTSRFFSGSAMTLLRATFAWQIFEITGSALHLGLMGLVQFVPTLALSLVGGAVADSFDRRRVAMLAQVAALAGSATLGFASAEGPASLLLLYGVILTTSAAAAFEGPARAALLPTLVSRDLFPSAVTLHSSLQQLGWVMGPVAMGFVIDAAGIATAYALHVGLVLLSLVALAGVRPPAAEGRREVSVAAVREGVAFVRRRPIVLGAMALDMFAVIFASATALLPVYANEILGVGPRGYGLLSSALELGTFLMALLLLVLRPIRRPGRALLLAVGVYGLATVLFGLSRSFPLSLAAFALAGMADQVSMVTRATLIQLSTPDALRGRVSAVNLVFIGASNQLGAVESGFVAWLTNAPFAVVSGGLACLAVLVAISPATARHLPPREQNFRSSFQDLSIPI